MPNNTKKIFNKIIIGTAQFGLNYGVANTLGKAKISNIKKILKFSKKKNVNFIDTAQAYGDCEERLGKIGLKGFNVLVKLPVSKPNNDIDTWLKDCVKSSFTKMKIKKAHTLLVHNTKYLLSKKYSKDYAKTLYSLKKQKKFSNIGVSVYSLNELKKILKIIKVDTVLMSFNIFDQRVLQKDFCNLKKKHKFKLYTRSTFLQGLLLMPKKRLPQKFKKWSKLFNKWYVDIKNNKCSSYEIALNFALNQKIIDKVLIGVESFSQFKKIFYSIKKINFNFIEFKQNKNIKLINPAKWNSI